MVFPTDTVYGLGTDPRTKESVARLIEVKRRPSDLPLPLLVGSVEQLMDVVPLTQLALDLCNEYLPGPLTLVIPYTRGEFLQLTAGSGSLGLRIPDNDFCQRLTCKWGPMIGTSANIHGNPSALSIHDARSQFGDRISLYLDGGMASKAISSTVIEVIGDDISLLREGVIPWSSLERFHGDR